jgi:hypothetical protein
MLKKTVRFSQVFILIVLLTAANGFSQSKTIMISDSLLSSDIPGLESFQSKSKLNPERAGLLSAILPGAGQVYNKQFWKLPIIYGGAIAFGHFIKYNNDKYNDFRNAYVAKILNEEDVFPRSFTSSALELNALYFKRNRDYLIILGAAFYLLQIVDAHVAAHLIEFEINDDLSMVPTYQPREQYFTQNLGLSLVLKLNK